MGIFDLFKPDVGGLEARGDVKRLIRSLKYKRDHDIRRTAARALGKIKDVRASKPLVQALEDEDGSVRRAVASALGEIKDARAVAALIQALKDEERGVRAAAAQALGEIKDARAVGSLTQALEGKYNDIRGAAAEALREILGEEEAYRRIRQFLRTLDYDNFDEDSYCYPYGPRHDAENILTENDDWWTFFVYRCKLCGHTWSEWSD